MRVLMQGRVVDGPYAAETGDDSLAATFLYADTPRSDRETRPTLLTRRARCEVICRGALALTVLLDIREGTWVQVAGELRLSASEEDSDLVLATVEADDVTSAVRR
jgi:hypothetical protein